MRKLITTLVVGLFATGVFAADAAAPAAPAAAPAADDAAHAKPAKKVMKKHQHKKGEKHATEGKDVTKDENAGK